MAEEKEFLLLICLACFPDGLLTPLLLSYADHQSFPSYRSTLGVNHPTKQIKLENNNIKLILIDISTDSCFIHLRLSYYRKASAAVFAFSKSNQSFIESATAWYHEFKDTHPHSTFPIAFVGLHSESEIVTLLEAQSLTQKLGASYHEMAVDDLLALDTILKSVSRKVIALKTS